LEPAELRNIIAEAHQQAAKQYLKS